MRGLIFASVSGACLGTRVQAKPLISVCDKPMIYYPLSVLLLAGIKQMLIISMPQDTPLFQKLLGDGSQWGINLSYGVQPPTRGLAQELAQAFIIGAEFIGNHSSALIRGDNIFYGGRLTDFLQHAVTLKKGARILAYPLSDPEKYDGVVFDENGKAYALPEREPERVPEKPAEKPPAAKSDYAVTGLCFYDSSAPQRARSLMFSACGEFAITALNKTYLDDDMLYVDALTHETTWFDIGTDDSLLEAARCIETVEQGQAMKIGCPEEICWRKGYIDDGQLENLATQMQMNDYGKYLKALLGGTDDALKGIHGTLSE